MRRREANGERMLLNSGCKFLILWPFGLIPFHDHETERLLYAIVVHSCILGLVISRAYTVSRLLCGSRADCSSCALEK